MKPAITDVINSLNSSNSKSDKRIAVDPMLVDLAKDTILESFKQNGDTFNSLSMSSVVEIALMQLLNNQDKKLITAQLHDTKLNTAIRKIVFGSSSMQNEDTGATIQSIYDYVKALDRSRRSSDQLMMTMMYTQALQTKLEIGKSDFEFNSLEFSQNLNTIMNEMYREDTNQLVNDLRLQTSTILQRNSKNNRK